MEVTLTAEYRPDSVPFMASQVAKVHEGRFAGTEVLMGMGGPILHVWVDGVQYGAVGFTYSALAIAVLNPFADHLDRLARSVPEAMGL